jgi:hypothetical protein
MKLIYIATDFDVNFANMFRLSDVMLRFACKCRLKKTNC